MPLPNGYGKLISGLNSTPQFVRINEENRQYFANRIIISNAAGTTNVRAVLNCANAADFAALSGNALVVKNGWSLEIIGDGFPPITTIGLSSPDGACDVIINAY